MMSAKTKTELLAQAAVLIASIGTAIPSDEPQAVSAADIRSSLESVINHINDLTESTTLLYTPQMFGAVGDGVTDDWPAFALMFAVAGGNGKGTFYPKGPKCFIPAAKYKLTSAPLAGIQLKSQVIIEGDAGGMTSGFPGTELMFPEDAKGIVVNRYNTLNGENEVTPTGGADCSIIRNIILTGNLGSDPTAHGIWLRARALIDNVVVKDFSGNGIHIVADAQSQFGNANCFQLMTVVCQNNGLNGVYCQGGDTNSGFGIGVDARTNGRWGIYDSSFLGNTWFGCHTSSNGVAGVGNNSSSQSSFVHYEGNRYGAVGTEEELVVTIPGTDEAVWKLMGSGSVHSQIPTWQQEQSVGTYFQGGPYKSDGASESTLWLGCYTESGQSGCWFTGPTIAFGGSIGSAGYVKGGAMRGENGNRLLLTGSDAGVITKGGTTEATLGGSSNSVLQWIDDGDNTSTWRLRRVGFDFRLDNQNSNDRVVFKITGQNTTEQMGTGISVPYKFVVQQLAIGIGTNIRRQSTSNALPTSGVYAQGDVIWKTNPSAGGSPGWVCTTPGTAGVDAVFSAMANLV